MQTSKRKTTGTARQIRPVPVEDVFTPPKRPLRTIQLMAEVPKKARGCERKQFPLDSFISIPLTVSVALPVGCGGFTLLQPWILRLSKNPIGYACVHTRRWPSWSTGHKSCYAQFDLEFVWSPRIIPHFQTNPSNLWLLSQGGWALWLSWKELDVTPYVNWYLQIPLTCHLLSLSIIFFLKYGRFGFPWWLRQ